VPRNAFVPLATLQEFLAKPRAGQQAPGVARPINALLAADAADVMEFARREGLTAHARAVGIRTNR